MGIGRATPLVLSESVTMAAIVSATERIRVGTGIALVMASAVIWSFGGTIARS